MDKRKGYVLLLINAGVRNSVSERKKSWRLLHYVSWHPVITLASKRAFRVLLLELGNFRQVAKHCLELSPLTFPRNPPLLPLSSLKEKSLLPLLSSYCYIFYFIIILPFHIFSSLLILNVFRWKYIFACLLSSTVQF